MCTLSFVWLEKGRGAQMTPRPLSRNSRRQSGNIFRVSGKTEDVQGSTCTAEARSIIGIGFLVDLRVAGQLAGHNSDVLLAVRTAVADRRTTEVRTGAEGPENLASGGVDSAELAGVGTAEHEVACSGEDRYGVLAGFSFDTEHLLAGYGVPGLQFAAPAGGARTSVGVVHQDVAAAGCPVSLGTGEGCAVVLSLEVDQTGLRVVGVVVPVVAGDERAHRNGSFNARVHFGFRVDVRHAGFHVNAERPVHIDVRVRLDEELAGVDVVDVEEAVTGRLEQGAYGFAVDLEVSYEVLAWLVEVPLVLRSVGVGPHHLTSSGITCDRGCAVL